MPLTLDKYETQKAANLVQLFKIGPKTAAVGTPRWNPDTGEQLDAELTTFNLENIDADIAKAEAALSALRALRADVAATLGTV